MSVANSAGAHEETGASRSARLDRILAELVGQVPEIEAAAVVSFDGLPMASALPPAMDEDRVAAMSAALLSLGERAAEGLGRGELSQVYVEGENGTVFLISADDEAVLVAVAAKGAKVGLMLFEVRRAAQALGAALAEDGFSYGDEDDEDDAEPTAVDAGTSDADADSDTSDEAGNGDESDDEPAEIPTPRPEGRLAEVVHPASWYSAERQGSLAANPVTPDHQSWG